MLPQPEKSLEFPIRWCGNFFVFFIIALQQNYASGNSNKEIAKVEMKWVCVD